MRIVDGPGGDDAGGVVELELGGATLPLVGGATEPDEGGAVLPGFTKTGGGPFGVTVTPPDPGGPFVADVAGAVVEPSPPWLEDPPPPPHP